MIYATRADLIKRFGSLEIEALEDPDNTGAPSATVSTEALKDASDVISSYVSVRYKPPLPSIPAPLKLAACDVARFQLYKDRPTEQVTYRYEKTIKWLEQLSSGKVLLEFDPALTVDQVDDIIKPVAAVGAQQLGGVFGEATFKTMPNVFD